MWSDNEAAIDLLDVGHLAAGVVHTVTTDALLPVSVGVYGDWGGGKSSLLKIACKNLQSSETLIVAFNGWQFEGYEDAKSALMGTIIDEVLAQQNLSAKAKDLGLKLLKRVNWFRLMGLATKSIVTLTTGLPAVGFGDLRGLVAAKAGEVDVDEAEKLKLDAPVDDDDPRTKVRAFRKEFSELLVETKVKRLVVVIDDLDRCLPPTVIETLEAIRLFLFVERTAFIIGADEDLVRHAVNIRFPEAKGTAQDVGQAYLEKLVQVPIRVPPLSAFDVERFMCLLFVELHLGADKAAALFAKLPRRNSRSTGAPTITEKDLNQVDTGNHEDLHKDLAVCAQIGDVLGRGLHGNPRQVKRFLNALLLRTQMAKSANVTLERRVLAKLMLLEYLRSQEFRLLFDSLDEHGCAQALADAEKAKSDEPTAGKREEASAKSDGDGDAEKKAAQPVRATEFDHWASDPWLNRWLSIDPPLGKVDLRDYFYFSRDKLGPVSFLVKQLSPRAQQLFSALTSASKVQRAAATNEVGALSPLDASSLVDAFAQFVRRLDGHQGTDSHLETLLDVGAKRIDMLGEVLNAIAMIPVDRVGTNFPLRVLQVADGTAQLPLANKLLEKWASSTNSGLAKAVPIAKQQQQRPKPQRGRR